VAVIVAVPGRTPFTNPVRETLAICGMDETHETLDEARCPVATNCKVDPWAIVGVAGVTESMGVCANARATVHSKMNGSATSFFIDTHTSRL
jgi:hypothetical protein